jgi:hypothetical protein
MATKEAKEKDETQRDADREATHSSAGRPLKESEIKRPGLEKYFPPGPWTDEDEKFFQIMIKEFGGVDRLEAASLAISVVTIAETRAGYRLAEWGESRPPSRNYSATFPSRSGGTTRMSGRDCESQRRPEESRSATTVSGSLPAAAWASLARTQGSEARGAHSGA